MDAPLMNANDGTPSVASLPNTRWPRRPISSTCSCDVSCRKTLRSAPTLKMNGLPVRHDRDEVVAGGDLVECGLQGRQRRRAEGVRALVVASVVEGEQRGPSRAAWQVDVVDLRLGHDLVGEVRQRRCAAHARLPSPSWSGFSQMTVPPWPRPTHIVVMP